MKILLAGVNGFVGKHLAQEASKAGHEVYGTSMQDTVDPEIKDFVVGYAKADMTKKEEVAKLPLETLDAVINLAGLAAVGPSFDDPEKYMKVNVEAHTVICDELIALGSNARVLCVSTGAVYDNTGSMPVSEDSPLLQPGVGSPYSHSKIAMEREVLMRADAIDVVIARPFNHFGPGQLPGFLVPQVFEEIRLSLEKDNDSILLGPMDTARDFTDVRDVARAYIALLETKDLQKQTVFNVCSGEPTYGKDIVDRIQQITQTDLAVSLDEKRVRPHDPKLIYGNNSRIKEIAGWSPAISLEQTLEDTYSTLRS